VASAPGNGLAGLRERLAGVGGTITATGTPRGFTVRAELSPIGTSTADQPLSVDA
jgi:signal transduction histidine kinase